ncbi:DUF2093 domain-containing protein [Pseudochelatococcus contaminans]|uniref:DUF2093 domain-containing protein n=1 Tax=Pseudochelatococcus contaminans TaxID=1538103 RepID=A0A7W6EEJ4_9HYPH|nr:DUF2093 domain-containing protein [Pseudochelatococcus contaminans]MBB3808221.1 hypothetical protein [Pseudochelatococcus contaminans]
MNRQDFKFSGAGEAQLQYLDGDYRVVRSGTFVRCAVTGRPIPLDELRYWNVDLQEAYISPEAVRERLIKLGQIKPAQ